MVGILRRSAARRAPPAGRNIRTRTSGRGCAVSPRAGRRSRPRARLLSNADADVRWSAAAPPTGVIGGTTPAASSPTVRDIEHRVGGGPVGPAAARGRIEQANAQASAADLAAARLLGAGGARFRLFQCGSWMRKSSCSMTPSPRSRSRSISRRTDTTQGRGEGGSGAGRRRSSRARRRKRSIPACQRAQLEHAIAILIGKAPAEFSIAAAPLAARCPRVPAGLPSSCSSAADVAAAERRVAAANAQIGVARRPISRR